MTPEQSPVDQILDQRYPYILYYRGASIRDITRMEQLDDAEPFTPAELKERGLPEPTR